MEFIKIGDKYYNKNYIICAFMQDTCDGKGRFCVNFDGGKTVDVSEEEFYNIIGIKKKKRIVE